MSCRRPRAARLAHVQQTTSQDHRPAIGQTLADQRHRAGVAERCAAPAVHQRLAVDLARLDSDEQRLRALACARVKTATPHDATTCDRRPSVPGIGQLLALLLRDASHALQRVPRVQALVSSGRLVTGAKASAGQRDGTSGTTIGHASRTWACAAAAGLCLRDHPRGQTALASLAQPQGQGTALTVLAHPLARAVSDLCTRDPAFDRRTCLPAAWRGVGAPVASLEHRGLSLGLARCQAWLAASVHAAAHGGFVPCSWRVAWTPTPPPVDAAGVAPGSRGCPSPDPPTNGRTRTVPPPRCRGRYEGPKTFLGRSGPPQQLSASAASTATAPPDVGGADPCCPHRQLDMTPAHGTRRRLRSPKDPHTKVANIRSAGTSAS